MCGVCVCVCRGGTASVNVCVFLGECTSIICVCGFLCVFVCTMYVSVCDLKGGKQNQKSRIAFLVVKFILNRPMYDDNLCNSQII